MPNLYMMIGVPGSGKSTWVKNQDWASECVIVDTDFYVEKFARRTNRTYASAFAVFMERAVRLMTRKVIRARELNKDIIWDQTSTTIASRKRKFRMLPNYYAIAVVMKKIDRSELDERLNARTGKVIPKDVVDSMSEFYEEPSTVEGFKEIWNAG